MADEPPVALSFNDEGLSAALRVFHGWRDLAARGAARSAVLGTVVEAFGVGARASEGARSYAPRPAMGRELRRRGPVTVPGAAVDVAVGRGGEEALMPGASVPGGGAVAGDGVAGAWPGGGAALVAWPQLLQMAAGSDPVLTARGGAGPFFAPLAAEMMVNGAAARSFAPRGVAGAARDVMSLPGAAEGGLGGGDPAGWHGGSSERPGVSSRAAGGGPGLAPVRVVGDEDRDGLVDREPAAGEGTRAVAGRQTPAVSAGVPTAASFGGLLEDYFWRQARLPPAGGGAFDPRLTPLWAGQKQPM